MSEPTSALNFEDLILRIAREAGVAYHGTGGGEKAHIPVDDHDLDLCKRIINDGIRMFISDAPVKGWRWMRRKMSVTTTATRITGTVDSVSGSAPGSYTLVDLTLATTYDTDDDLKGYWIYVLTGTGKGCHAEISGYTAISGTCTVLDWYGADGMLVGYSGSAVPVATDTFAITAVETVEGDIARYLLAEDFGGETSGQIHYAKSTNRSTGIEWCDESFIRAKRSVSVQIGNPLLAAIRPLEPKSNGIAGKRRFELILDPQPSAAVTLEFPYPLYFDELLLEAGTVSSATATTVVDSTLANVYDDDYFKGWTIRITGGTGKGGYAVVTGSTGSSCTFTHSDMFKVNGDAGGTDPVDGDTYIITPPQNKHPAGLRFDETVKSACLAQAEMEIEDVQTGFTTKYMQKDLPNAHKIDMRSAPRTLGSMNKRCGYERTWNTVTNDNDS